VVRTTVAVIGLVYVNFVISRGWPAISNRFAAITSDWDISHPWAGIILTILSEMLMLHLLVVITRLVLLRKKVFDNTD
jgi:hypothetical protein